MLHCSTQAEGMTEVLWEISSLLIIISVAFFFNGHWRSPQVTSRTWFPLFYINNHRKQKSWWVTAGAGQHWGVVFGTTSTQQSVNMWADLLQKAAVDSAALDTNCPWPACWFTHRPRSYFWLGTAVLYQPGNTDKKTNVPFYPYMFFIIDKSCRYLVHSTNKVWMKPLTFSWH